MKAEQKTSYEQLIAIIAEENKRADWKVDFTDTSQEKYFFIWDHYNKRPQINNTFRHQSVSSELYFMSGLASKIQKRAGLEMIRLAIVGE